MVNLEYLGDNMLQEIISFLDGNKELIGAVAVLTEILIIVINFVRKVRSEAIPQGVAVIREQTTKTSFVKRLLWSANPLNLKKRL